MKAVEKPRVTLDQFKASLADAIAAGEVDQVDPPVEHYYTPDLYGRRIFVDKDTAIMTKVHKTEHITIALKGHCTVVDENGVKTEVVAPAVFVTKPGTRRAVYAHDDVEWVTVHACALKDLGAIEEALVCESQEEYDREDYNRVLLEYNMNEKWARAISENPRTLTAALPEDADNVQICPSSLEGMGVFANKDFEVGDRIGATRLGTLRTPIGRFTNHSARPNCEFRVSDRGIDAFAIRPISKGQEVTVCYRLARKVSIEAIRFLENPS
jgi:quercetin dioxygenase-like cupin family protein